MGKREGVLPVTVRVKARGKGLELIHNNKCRYLNLESVS